MSLRTLSYLAFTMFVVMWLLAIAQSPGGMSAFAHEIATVEQQLLPQQHEEPVQTASGNHATFEAYPGGILCEETTDANGAPDTSCQVPVPMFPY